MADKQRWIDSRLLLAGFLAAAAVLSPVLAQLTPSQADTLEDIVNIDFRVDIRLFTVMAALNVAGFDFERPGAEMSPTRIALRKELENLDPDLKIRLKSFHRSWSPSRAQSIQSAYTSLALLIGGPPDFELLDNLTDIPGEAIQISGFSELLPEFYRKASIESLWEKYRPVYIRELEKYRPVAKKVVIDTLKYFRIPARVVLDRQIIIMPDLLGYQDIVNARNLEKTYYIVVGPTEKAESNYYQLQHEYLHFLIDPLIRKYGGRLMELRTLLDLADDQPGISSEFRGRFLLIVGESLIEALLSRFHPPENLEAHEVRLSRQGFIFTPAFIRALDEFEKTPEIRLPLFLAKTFNALSESVIEDDQKRITRIRKLLVREQSAAEAARQRELEEQQRRQAARNRFNAAGLMIRQGEWEKARTILEELLAEDPENGNIFFYLAQIEAHGRHYDKALELYLRTVEAPNVPAWVRARALLQVGRFYANDGKFKEARQVFNQVLQLEGDLKGAAKEARELLNRLPADKR